MLLKKNMLLKHVHFFFLYKNNFIRTRDSFLLKIKEQIKNNPSLGRRKVSKLQLNVVNKSSSKCSTISKQRFASCLFTHSCWQP